jgi:iron complex outermembrane receptor protein
MLFLDKLFKGTGTDSKVRETQIILKNSLLKKTDQTFYFKKRPKGKEKIDEKACSS